MNHNCSYSEFFCIAGLDTGKSKLHKGISDSFIIFLFIQLWNCRGNSMTLRIIFDLNEILVAS